MVHLHEPLKYPCEETWLKSLEYHYILEPPPNISPTVKIQTNNPAVRGNWEQLATVIAPAQKLSSLHPDIDQLRENGRMNSEKPQWAEIKIIKLDVKNSAVDNIAVYMQGIPPDEKMLLLQLRA